MEYFKLNNGIQMPMVGIGVFTFTPAEAQDDLGGRFAVLLTKLREDGFFDQALIAMAQRIPGHQADAIRSQ